MKEVKIYKNDNDQRLDRFLRKYLSKAPRGFIYKMIRRKNIKINKKRARPETIIYEGDTIQLYLADDTIEKFVGEEIEVKSNMDMEVIYQDSNIILINKPAGILSHDAGDREEDNIVNGMISYLIDKKEFDPEKEKTFTPAICNRLDRNTSGIIIGAKNYEALKQINEAIRQGEIRRFYKTLVKGNFEAEVKAKGYLTKDKDKNKVQISRVQQKDSKEVITNIKPLKNKNGYTILEIELITGRTHQIRGHLSAMGYPIIGDRKYGDPEINRSFNQKHMLNNQFLHGYKIELKGFHGKLKYLNKKEFVSELRGIYKEIERELF